MGNRSGRNCRRWRGLALIAVLMVLQSASFSQDASGRIVGTVTDPQGGVIVGAKVAITNIDTQVSREAVTDKDGYFQVLSLPLGTYQMTVEQQGFKKAVADLKPLQINQVMKVDTVLQLGSTTESVVVAATATTVETVNPTVGASVTARPIVDLPLNGRNVMSLALLQPGVTESTGTDTISIAGGRDDSITYLLDGGNNNNLLSNRQVFNPNPDTIAEFRLLTSNYTAEYGRNGGGIISVVTKSGTNDIHGSAFEFLRNDALNANTFFNNLNGVPREILKRNQFGFTLGGPVYLPKLINGKDRLFIFGSYQGQRLSKTQTSTTTTFTPAELAGNFSRSNATGTGPDENVVAFLEANPFFQSNPALAAQGIIDPARINSVAKKYISSNLIPTSAAGRIVSQAAGLDNNDELLLKTDAKLTEKDNLAVTLGSGRAPTLNPFQAANVAGYPNTGNNRRYFANFAYTRVFSPTLLNEFRFTTQRINTVQSVPGSSLPKAADLGVGVTPDNPTGPPRLDFNSGLSIGFSVQGPTTLINNTFSYSDTLTWQKGNHGLKFGFSFSPYQNNTVYDFYVNGNFFFSGDPAVGGIGSGNDFADFLFGLPDEYLQFGEAPSNIRSKSTYAFAQDEWKVRKNLSLTFGLRYEYSQPKFDTQGRSFSLKYGAQSKRFVNAPVGLLFPGDPEAPKGANFPDRNDWAPRFGFAWDPFNDGKTSIRGGVGVFYDILKGEDNLQFNGQAPFFGFADLFFDPLEENPTAEVNYLNNPFVAAGIPNSFPSKPPASNLDFDAAGFLPAGGGGVYFVDPNLRTPYTYQYNLSVQRQLTRDLTVEANYVGHSDHKLTGLADANPYILGTLSRKFNAQPGNDDFSFSYLDEFRNVGNANYNSLQLSLTQRPSTSRLGTTYYTFAYTLGHLIDTASGFRERGSNVPTYATKLFRADGDTDIRHRISFSGGWDLPFGKSGPLRRLTGGWSVYPIVSYRTGFPLDIFAGLSRARNRPGPSGAGDGSIVHANLVGSSIALLDPKTSQSFNSRQGNYWFNPANVSRTGLDAVCNACATNPALRTYGTLPRNFFRGPGRSNFDLSLAKSTPIFGEHLRAEFRAEFFNIFNTAQFLNPTTGITSALFGQITTTADPRIIQFALRLKF
jgi:hypothetical protein